MKIIINGRFLTQKMTGVQRYTYQLLKEINQLIDKEEIDKKIFNLKFCRPKILLTK